MRFLDGRSSKSRLVKISVLEAGRNEVSEATTGTPAWISQRVALPSLPMTRAGPHHRPRRWKHTRLPGT